MIFWVFGGTAVGKKRFIEQCVNGTRPEYIDSKKLRAVWMHDGPAGTDIAGEANRSDIMVRWQWGREEMLDAIGRKRPQTIVLLTADLITQLSRIWLREGGLKWNANQVHGEQRDIYECVHTLQARFSLPVLYVDSTTDHYQLRRRLP